MLCAAGRLPLRRRPVARAHQAANKPSREVLPWQRRKQQQRRPSRRKQSPRRLLQRKSSRRRLQQRRPSRRRLSRRRLLQRRPSRRRRPSSSTSTALPRNRQRTSTGKQKSPVPRERFRAFLRLPADLTLDRFPSLGRIPSGWRARHSERSEEPQRQLNEARSTSSLARSRQEPRRCAWKCPSPPTS